MRMMRLAAGHAEVDVGRKVMPALSLAFTATIIRTTARGSSLSNTVTHGQDNIRHRATSRRLSQPCCL